MSETLEARLCGDVLLSTWTMAADVMALRTLGHLMLCVS